MTDATAVATTAPRERIAVAFDRTDPRAMYLDTGVFEQLNRVAVALSQSALVPEHLQKQPANCLLITAQSMRWNIDPLVCAQHSFVHKGKIGYEGKLVAAIVNAALAAIGSEPLDYEYSNVGNDRKIVISATVNGKVKTVEGFLSKWKTENKAWSNDPDQMLVYRGSRQWARRWMPEVLLGVSGGADEPDERDTIDITDRARVTDVSDALATGGTPAAEPERPVRKRRTKAEIEADDAAHAAADERARLEAQGQQTLPVVTEGKPEPEDAVLVEDPPADELPAEPEPEAPSVGKMLEDAVAEKKISAAQQKWMMERLAGLDGLTSAKAVDLMHAKMVEQLKAHPTLAAVWEVARKIASGKFK